MKRSPNGRRRDRSRRRAHFLARQDDRSYGALENVGVQLDPTVVEKQGEAVPAVKSVGDYC